MPDIPKSVQPTSVDVEIHVMPEEFIGAAAKAKIIQSPPTSPTQAAAGHPPAPPAPPPASPKPGVPTQPARGPKILIIIGALILAALGVGAYFVLKAPKPKPVPVPAERPAPLPEPVPAITVPPAATSSPPAPAPAPAPVVRAPLRSSIDTDVDGLTDEEEKLYGTDRARPDSDADGFLDGNEVFHLYSPTAPNPALLRDTGQAVPYTDNLGRYELLAPKAWELQTIDATRGLVKFVASTGEFVQISVEENPQGMTLEEWYRSRETAPTNVETVTTKQGYAALRSGDRLVMYVEFGKQVFVVRYEIGTLAETNFRRTFEMMVNSLRGIQP